jgi:hypothetical protein
MESAPMKLPLLLATLSGLAAACFAQDPVAPVAPPPPAEVQSDTPAAAAESLDEQQRPEPQKISLSDGEIAMIVPGEWKQLEPRNRIIAMEFQVPAPKVEGEAAPRLEDGRLTLSQAGGGIDANLQRWIGQFRLGRGADGADAMTKDTLQVDPFVIHTLDITGTYFDTPQGPFGPKQELPNYRMLGAIVETPNSGNWYLKFYGPKALVAANKELFDGVLKSLAVDTPAKETEATPTESDTAQSDDAS